MAEQLPEQLRSLVNIGMQGRSLGVHLVLATQRPSGVVTADLRANINLRIALRVASAEDSRDVIETVDAARIPVENSAGRAYAWLGGGRPAAFQAALVTGPRPDPAHPSDLSALVAAIQAAAHQEQIPRQASPWRSPLRDCVSLDQLPRLLARGGRVQPLAEQLVFGVVDKPAAQQQIPASFDIARGGHLLVAGAPQSGRTTLLRTLAASLLMQVHPDDAHLYVFDGGGGLAALSALPHCGAVVTPAESDRADRLLARLSAELTRRTRLMSAAGYGDLAEYRQANPAGGQTPFLLVFIDRYDAFVTALEQVDHGRLTDQLQRLIRDGLSARHPVRDRGRPVFADREASQPGRRQDRVADGGPGRIRTGGPEHPVGSCRHAQRARASHARCRPASGRRAVGGPAGGAQNRELRVRADQAGRPVIKPFRVDPLPVAITFEQACELPAGDGDGVIVGVGGDDLSLVRIQAPALLVMGPPGSGRSTALAVQARSLVRAGRCVVLVTPRPSTLEDALAPVSVRLHLSATGAEAAGALNAVLAEAGPAVLVVDDAELLNGTPLGDEVVAQCRRLRDSGHQILAATVSDSVTPLRGAAAELAKGKCGCSSNPRARSTASRWELGCRRRSCGRHSAQGGSGAGQPHHRRPGAEHCEFPG